MMCISGNRGPDSPSEERCYHLGCGNLSTHHFTGMPVFLVDRIGETLIMQSRLLEREPVMHLNIFIDDVVTHWSMELLVINTESDELVDDFLPDTFLVDRFDPISMCTLWPPGGATSSGSSDHVR